MSVGDIKGYRRRLKRLAREGRMPRRAAKEATPTRIKKK